MGELFDVTCDGCELERRGLMLGAGMAGIAYTPCTCTKCRKVIVKHDNRHDPRSGGRLRCPYCHRVATEITLVPTKLTAEVLKGSEPCPRCDGTLTFALCGLWD